MRVLWYPHAVFIRQYKHGKCDSSWVEVGYPYGQCPLCQRKVITNAGTGLM